MNILNRLFLALLLTAAMLGSGCATGIRGAAPPEAADPARQPIWAAIQSYRSGEPKKAVEPLTAWLASHPHDALAHYYLAEAHLDLGAYDKAAPHFRAALKTPPGTPRSALGRPTAASNPEAVRRLIGPLVQRIDAELARNPAPEAREREQLLRLLARAVELQARVGDPAARAALARLETHALALAVETVNRPRRTVGSAAHVHVLWNPLGPELLARGAIAYRVLGDQANARRLNQRAEELASESRNPGALAALVRVRADAGDIADAFALARDGGPYVSGMQNVRPHMESDVRLVLARQLGEASNYAAAEDAIQKMDGLDAGPRLDHGWSQLAQQLVQAGALERAAAAAMAIENARGRVLALNQVAAQAAAAGNPALAERCLRQAFAAYPEVRDARQREHILRILPEAATADTTTALTRLTRRPAGASRSAMGATTGSRHSIEDTSAPAPVAKPQHDVPALLARLKRDGQPRHFANWAHRLALEGDIESMQLLFRETGKLDIAGYSTWLAIAWLLAGETEMRVY
jgi:tetratricopeptide (TPR) repeat protein